MRKQHPYWRMIVDALLVCCGTLAAVLMVPSAYDVRHEIATLVYISILFSFSLSFLLHKFKKPFFPIIVFLLAAAIYLIADRHSVKMGFKILYYTILRPPSSILPFLPVPKEPVVAPTLVSGYVTSFLIVVAALYSLVIALTVIKSRSPIPAIVVLLPAVFTSMVYTDCSPALHSVILLVVYFGGVLLGNGISGGTKKHAIARLVFLLLLTALAFILRALSPEKKYVPIPYEQRQYILGERFGRVQDGLLSLISSNPKQYGLSSISDRIVDDTKAFSVKSSKPGSFLLRTHSYGLYSYNTFVSSPEYDGEWRSLHALGMTQAGSFEVLSIQGALTNERIVPYAFSRDAYVKVEEGFVRAYGETAYSWQFKPELRFAPIKSTKDESDYYLFALNNYTIASSTQKQPLIDLMNRSFPIPISSVRSFSELIERMKRTDHYSAALAVAQQVRAIGEYTLTPGSAPRGKDLIEYFVSENKKGYCVHYAATTAAFLQAMNIPARYTIGYRVDIDEADEWQDVTRAAAHAWVEVYIKGVGWVPIECTPGFPGNNDYAPVGGNVPVPTPTPEPTPTPTPDPNAPETTPPDIERPSRSPRESATPRPTNTPRPGGSGGGSGGKGGGSLLWLLCIPGVIALFALVGFVVDRIRKRRFNQSDPNAAVLRMLRYLRGLERFGLPPEPDAKELGEEAAFSNHSMSAKQGRLIERCDEVRRSAFKRKPFKRFLLRRILFRL